MQHLQKRYAVSIDTARRCRHKYMGISPGDSCKVRRGGGKILLIELENMRRSGPPWQPRGPVATGLKYIILMPAGRARLRGNFGLVCRHYDVGALSV